MLMHVPTALKIGEIVYRCRTCYKEYQMPQELCTDCFVKLSPLHASHEFGRLLLQKANDMPDDIQIQQNICWQCADPGCGRGM